MKPTVLMLVGVPGSGKTTFCEAKTDEIVQTYNITDRISSDDIIEDIAHSIGETYRDVFGFSIGVATDYLEVMIRVLSLAKRSFIIDSTNLTSKARKRKINLLNNRKAYDVIAITFDTPETEELRSRLDNRAERNGKDISPELTIEMINKYVAPTLEEGFDKIMNVKDFVAGLGKQAYGQARFG